MTRHWLWVIINVCWCHNMQRYCPMNSNTTYWKHTFVIAVTECYEIVVAYQTSFHKQTAEVSQYIESRGMLIRICECSSMIILHNTMTILPSLKFVMCWCIFPHIYIYIPSDEKRHPYIYIYIRMEQSIRNFMPGLVKKIYYVHCMYYHIYFWRSSFLPHLHRHCSVFQLKLQFRYILFVFKCHIYNMNISYKFNIITFMWVDWDLLSDNRRVVSKFDRYLRPN